MHLKLLYKVKILFSTSNAELVKYIIDEHYLRPHSCFSSYLQALFQPREDEHQHL